MTVYFDKAESEMLLDEVWLSKENHIAYLAFVEGNGVLGQLSTLLTAAPKIKYFAKVEI